jgi:hypothetical protein
VPPIQVIRLTGRFLSFMVNNHPESPLEICFLWLPLDDVVIGHVTEKGELRDKFISAITSRMGPLNEPGKSLCLSKGFTCFQTPCPMISPLMNEWMSYSGEHFLFGLFGGLLKWENTGGRQ